MPAIQLAIQAMTFLGVVVGAFIAYRIHVTKILSDYSDKYNRAIAVLPAEYFRGNFTKRLDEFPNEVQNVILSTSSQIFTVFAQECELRERYKFISRKVWRNWLDGDRKNMRYAFMRDARQILAYRYHARFVNFMTVEIIARCDDPNLGWI